MLLLIYRPNDPRMLVALGEIYHCLDRNKEAIKVRTILNFLTGPIFERSENQVTRVLSISFKSSVTSPVSKWNARKHALCSCEFIQ